MFGGKLSNLLSGKFKSSLGEVRFKKNSLRHFHIFQYFLKLFSFQSLTSEMRKKFSLQNRISKVRKNIISSNSYSVSNFFESFIRFRKSKWDFEKYFSSHFSDFSVTSVLNLILLRVDFDITCQGLHPKKSTLEITDSRTVLKFDSSSPKWGS